MDELVQFVTNQGLYEFDRQESLTDNFRSVDPLITRMPGVDGGFDEYGNMPAPKSVGVIRSTHWIIEDTPEAVQQQKHQLAAMTSWGVGRLYKRTTGGELRWCEARLSEAPYAHEVGQLPHARMHVSFQFQSASPFWLSQGTQGNSWNDGVAEWDDGVTYWGGALPFTNLTGESNDVNINVGGNAPTAVRLDLRAPAGKSAQNVRVRRVVFGAAVDEMAYNAVLTAGQRLIVDTRFMSVTLNGSDAYGAAFSYLDPRWLWLLPGDNTIQVLMQNASDEIDIRLLYYEMSNT
jgi:hypothetical protein